MKSRRGAGRDLDITATTQALQKVERFNAGMSSAIRVGVGSIAGGWLSSALIHRGWTINRARKTTMLICALAVTPIFFAQYVDGLWSAVFIIGLAAAAHQAWSANLYTLPSDVFPRKAVGSVIGTVAAPAFLEVVRWKGLLSVDLDLPAPWLA